MASSHRRFLGGLDVSASSHSPTKSIRKASSPRAKQQPDRAGEGSHQPHDRLSLFGESVGTNTWLSHQPIGANSDNGTAAKVTG